MAAPYQRYLFMFILVASIYFLILRVPGGEEEEEEEKLLEQDREAQQQPHREPAPYYERRIVGIGDLHGDLPNALKVLKMTDVIDDEGHWSGNVDFLVQTGDIIDRGDDTIVLFKLMERLREEARLQGGVVLSNLGNHEWMNAIGDWRYVYDSEIKTFGGTEARQHALTSKGWLGRAWAQNYTVTTRLPMHPSLGPPNTDYEPGQSINHRHSNDSIAHAALSFVHGGLAPEFPYLTPYPSRINSIGKSLLRKLQTRTPPPPSPPNPYPGLPESATVAEQALYATEGPLWYRGWALDDEEKACAEIDDVLYRTGTRRLIMGHTPTFTNIVSRCKGKVIIIDTGISHAYGGVLSGLSITYSLHRAEGKPGMQQQSWIEKEKVAAVYKDSSKILVDEARHLTGDYGVYER